METREELARADGKAALLLAAIGVAVGALLSSFMGGDWTPFSLHNGIEWMWWLGVICLATSIVCLSIAVWPATSTREQNCNSAPAFYSDFASFENAASLRKALEDHRLDEFDRDTSQLHAVSKIVARKYRMIRWGIACTGLAALLCIGTPLANVFL